MPSFVMLSVVIHSIVYAEHRYEAHYAASRSTECCYAECYHIVCLGVSLGHAECGYT